MVRNQNMLETGNFSKLILNLCVPTVIVMLVMVLYNMADTFFIGQTGDPNQMAAVSLCAPVFSIISGFGTLFGNGGCTTISIALGENKPEKIKATTGFCFLSAVIVGILAMIFILCGSTPIVNALGADAYTREFTKEYLHILAIGAPALLFNGTFCNIIRSDGAAVQSMIANLLGTVSNIVLDAVFILGFQWGVRGAAYATVLGNVFSCIYLIWYITKSEILTLKIKEFLHNPKLAFQILCFGLPMACSTIIMSVSSIISNRIMIFYGSVALAAQGVAGKIGMLIGMLAMGICMGLQPAISYAYGRRNHKRIFEIVKKTAILTFSVGTCLAIAGFVFRNQIVQSFIDNDAVIQYGRIMVIGSVLVGPFVGWYQLCQTFLQSTGKANYATFVALLDKGLYYIPILLIMAKLFGVYGIAFASPVTTFFSLATGVVFCLRWCKKWKT